MKILKLCWDVSLPGKDAGSISVAFPHTLLFEHPLLLISHVFWLTIRRRSFDVLPCKLLINVNKCAFTFSKLACHFDTPADHNALIVVILMPHCTVFQRPKPKNFARGKPQMFLWILSSLRAPHCNVWTPSLPWISNFCWVDIAQSFFQNSVLLKKCV